jgi:hypothetical protein
MLKKTVRELSAKAADLTVGPCFDSRDFMVSAAAREHAAAMAAAERVLRRHADSEGCVALFARNSRRWSPPLAKAIAAAEKAVHDLVEQETAGS